MNWKGHFHFLLCFCAVERFLDWVGSSNFHSQLCCEIRCVSPVVASYSIILCLGFLWCEVRKLCQLNSGPVCVLTVRVQCCLLTTKSHSRRHSWHKKPLWLCSIIKLKYMAKVMYVLWTQTQLWCQQVPHHWDSVQVYDTTIPNFGTDG